MKGINAEGERRDFHSLRHTCGAWLAASGAHFNVAKSVMRHSSITLTMDTYGHLFPGEQAGATAAFDRLMPTTGTQLEATGTTGQTHPKNGSSIGSNRDAIRCESMRADASANAPEASHADDETPLKKSKKCEEVRLDAGENEKATDRNRTGNLRFTKPSGNTKTTVYKVFSYFRYPP
ncbi:tyrosine-type recombinase/integrase [Phycisphaeraceae bacterium D3-23]